jgi:hypothetical protein
LETFGCDLLNSSWVCGSSPWWLLAPTSRGRSKLLADAISGWAVGFCRNYCFEYWVGCGGGGVDLFYCRRRLSWAIGRTTAGDEVVCIYLGDSPVKVFAAWKEASTGVRE